MGLHMAMDREKNTGFVVRSDLEPQFPYLQNGVPYNAIVMIEPARLFEM